MGWEAPPVGAGFASGELPPWLDRSAHPSFDECAEADRLQDLDEATRERWPVWQVVLDEDRAAALAAKQAATLAVAGGHRLPAGVTAGHRRPVDDDLTRRRRRQVLEDLPTDLPPSGDGTQRTA